MQAAAKSSLQSKAAKPSGLCCPSCLQNKINCLIIMNLFDKIKEKAWQAIKRKAVEVIVAILTAAIAAITTTSCMGYGPL